MTPSISSTKGSSRKSTSVIVTTPAAESVASTLTVLFAARQDAVGVVLLQTFAVEEMPVYVVEELTTPVSVPGVPEAIVTVLLLQVVMTPAKSSMVLRLPVVTGALGIVRMLA